MTEMYRVSVERVVRQMNDAGVEVDRDYVSVVAFDGPAERLLRFAPGEVAAALGGEPAAQDAAHPQAALRVVQGAQRQSEPVTQAETPKRKRRTNAEIAADKAAQAAGFRDAAHQQETEAALARIDKAAEAAPAPEQNQVPVTEHVAASPTEPVAPAAPYNPFAAAK